MMQRLSHASTPHVSTLTRLYLARLYPLPSHVSTLTRLYPHTPPMETMCFFNSLLYVYQCSYSTLLFTV